MGHPPTTKNQLNGHCHDAAGNLLYTTAGSCGSGTPIYTYDAENRLTVTNGVTYAYDGDGNRVKKSNGKLYWMGGGGDVLTETDLSGTATADYIFFNGQRIARVDQPSGNKHFYMADHLGSTSVVTSNVGAIQDESDYYPFGGEIPIATTDPNNYKFTGKERDTESGLDYFSIRYMSSVHGRFTSADPLVWQSWQNGSDEERVKFREFINDPQNLNLYTYGRNNPLKFNDPTGLDVEIAITFVGDVTNEEKERIIAAVQTYLEGLKVGKVVVRDAADASKDKRSWKQMLKDSYATEFHEIIVDFAHPNPFGNNSDKPDFIKATNMMKSGEGNFGDLRKKDPQQWANIVAWRILHETISHAFGIGPDSDQLFTIKPGDPRHGTLIEGSYSRGKTGIPGLNPADTKELQKLLVPKQRSYDK